MQYQLMPSILAADHGRFIEEAQSVDMPEVEYLHVDVMDGHFVPNITFGPKVVASLKQQTRFQLDVHLMIERVDEYIPVFAEAGADTIIIHQEATRHLHRSLALIRQHGAKAGVALNPATPLETLTYILPEVHQVLIMSVNPGFGGQKFIESSIEKIRTLAEIRAQRQLSFLIEVDGGIDVHTAPRVVTAGANLLVAGSAIFGQPDRAAEVRRMLQAIQTALAKKRSLLV